MQETIRHTIKALQKLLDNEKVYVSGGAVRDLLLGRDVLDIDLVMNRDPSTMAKRFAQEIMGTMVTLDEDNQVYRVVAKEGFYFDFSAFRCGATSILDDLKKRDFAINAMAIELDDYIMSSKERIIDPLDGRGDIEKRILRACSSSSFSDDPLRILRAYRFSLELGFKIEPNTLDRLKRCQKEEGLKYVAPERIDLELSRILEHPSSWMAITRMAKFGTLHEVLPEIAQAQDVDQPGFHHLDVFWHLIETLRQLEEVIHRPGDFFKESEAIEGYLGENPKRVHALKWAALLHDIGKPHVKGLKGQRVTFYNHDKKGRDIATNIAKRLRWPNWREELVIKLISNHMRPFHLLNDLRRGGPSARAMRRLLNDLKGDYIGLFILSMADTLAGAGPLKPENLEQELSELFSKVHRFMLETLAPIKRHKRLLTGKDVMRILKIPQGPLVGQALDALEDAQCEGKIKDASSAAKFLVGWYGKSIH